MNNPFRPLTLTFLLIASPQVEAAVLGDLCAAVMRGYRVIAEAMDAPPVERTNQGDVFSQVYDEVLGKSSIIYFRKLLRNEETLSLVHNNTWLVRHWKFLWDFPHVNWEKVSESPPVAKGTGMFSLGSIEIILPKNGEIKITLKHHPQYAVSDIRQAIQDTDLYAKGLYPNMKVQAAGDPETTYIYLVTSSGYEANNAYIHGLVEHFQMVIDRNRNPPLR